MAAKSFRLQVGCNADQMHKLEAFIEDVCNYFNVFNAYFGNILVATTEFCSFVGFLVPGKLIEVNSFVKKGALVVGFNLHDEFNVVSPYLQQNVSQYLESETILEQERSLLSTILLSDDISLDFAQQKVEILFNIKTDVKDREDIISNYLERVVGTAALKTKKQV